MEQPAAAGVAVPLENQVTQRERRPVIAAAEPPPPPPSEVEAVAPSSSPSEQQNVSFLSLTAGLGHGEGNPRAR